MIYIYRSVPSDGAKAITAALGSLAARGMKPENFGRSLRTGDRVVCWGESRFNAPEGIEFLNGAPLRSKLEDAETLQSAGVPTITTARTRPTGQGPRPGFDLSPYTSPLDEVNAVALRAALTRHLSAPLPVIPVEGEWLPRRNDHMGGHDLMSPPTRPAFWVRKEAITQEFRVHSFRGQSIRAAQKIVRPGFKLHGTQGPEAEAHAWIRSYEVGWQLASGNAGVTEEIRQLAHRAVAALGLDFGAVDIGRRADGTLMVLEVNRAPGLEAGFTDAYARAIRAWARI